MVNISWTTFFYAAGTAVVAANGYLLWQLDSKQEPSSLVSQPAVKAQEEVEVAKLPNEVKLPDAPVITLLRVEPDGSAIIAGNGPKNSVISLLDGTTKIAQTTSEAGGDFAFVLDKPLEPGTHELSVLAMLKDGSALPSDGIGLVQIPEAKTGGELTVLLTKPGEPTKVLSKTKIEPVAAVAKAEPTSEVAQVVLKTADIEGNKIFVAGTGEPGSTIEIFLGDAFLGSTIVTADGSFLLEATQEIKAGKYVVLANSLDTETYKLLNKAEVTLTHEPLAAQVAVKAAEVDGNKVYVAGTGEPGSTIEIFLGDTFLGSTIVAENGSFLLEATQELEPGRYVVLVNSLNTETYALLNSAEVSLLHETDAKPAETAAQKPEKTEEVVTGTSVIIRRGDNLWRIARRNYGQGIRYTTIFEANKDQIDKPSLIFPGQVLKVPAQE